MALSPALDHPTGSSIIGESETDEMRDSLTLPAILIAIGWLGLAPASAASGWKYLEDR